jgi:hypothetical protein
VFSWSTLSESFEPPPSSASRRSTAASGTILEEAAVTGQTERDVVVASPLRNFPDVTASRDQDRHKAWRRPWKVMLGIPAGMTAGANPAHAARCAAVGNRDMSAPVSAMIACATVSPIPGMDSTRRE